MATTTTTTKTTTATAAAAATHFKVQTQQPIKPKRRRYRETTISSSATPITTTTAVAAATAATDTGSLTHNPTRKLDPPTVVSPDNSWCCPASKPLPLPLPVSSPPPPPPPPPRQPQRDVRLHVEEPDPTVIPYSPSSFRIRFSPGSLSPVMDFTQHTATPPPMNHGHGHSSDSAFPSGFSKFNSALTAGLLNPMSPPPDKTRSSPTLFEMMASEPDVQLKTQIPSAHNTKTTLQQQQ